MKKMWLCVPLLAMACGPMGTYEETTPEGTPGLVDQTETPPVTDVDDPAWVRAQVTIVEDERSGPLQLPYVNVGYFVHGSGEDDGGLRDTYAAHNGFTMLAGPRFEARRVVVRGSYASLGHLPEDNPCFPLIDSMDALTWELLELEVEGDAVRVSDPKAGTESLGGGLFEMTLEPGARGDALVRARLELTSWPTIEDWRDKTSEEQAACTRHMRETIGHRVEVEVPVTTEDPAKYTWNEGAEHIGWIGEAVTEQPLRVVDGRGESLEGAINWDPCQVMGEVWFRDPQGVPEITCHRSSSWARVEVPMGRSLVEFRMPNRQTLTLRHAEEPEIARAELVLEELPARRSGTVFDDFDDEGVLETVAGYEILVKPRWYDAQGVELQGMGLDRPWVRDAEMISQNPEVCEVTQNTIRRGRCDTQPDFNRYRLQLLSSGTCELMLRVVGEEKDHQATLTLPWREVSQRR